MSEVERLLQEILEEQKKHNQLMMLLIQALSDDADIDDDQPSNYLDGKPT